MGTKKWEILKKRKIKIEEVVNVLLENRGIKLSLDKKEFINPTSPEKLTLKALGISKLEVSKAIKRIKIAKENKENVIIYGDYDADGICGTAILWESLHKLGLKVMPFIPDRFSEGYGLNIESIKKLKTKDQKLGLIVTVDHGIVANEKINFAKKLGIDVIITDHHDPEKNRPEALATVHTTKIGGAAVAWILSREIAKNFGFRISDFEITNSLELVAIGTIADQLPLIGPNRSFVKFGLVELTKTQRPGLLALFEESGITHEFGIWQAGTYEIGFILAPRINATGRLAHAIDSLRLLCTQNRIKASQLATYLGKTNQERQKIVDEVVLHTKSQHIAKKNGLIIVSDESYHEGVIGLAAAKLVEEFYRPSIVISKKGNIAKASARSIPGFNIIEVIRLAKDFILEGGGHPMAAGFSLETAKIGSFIKKINQVAAKLLTSELLTKKLKIDAEISFPQITMELVNQIKLFEPTGLGNPIPVFVSRAVYIEDARLVGRDSKHLKLKLKQEEKIFDAIGFGMGEVYSKLSSHKPIDVACSLEEDTWNGNSKIQLKIKDLKI